MLQHSQWLLNDFVNLNFIPPDNFVNDYFLLGLCPDWCDMKPENALQNAKEAMNLADDWLGVPQVS